MWLDIKIHKEARYYQPYLNGEELKDCFAANEEEGWADIYERNEIGLFTITIVNGEEEVKKKRVFGKVELKRIYGEV